MDAARWERVQSLFHRALEYPEERRTEYLKNECCEAPDLLEEVHALLDEDARESVLDSGATHIAREMIRESMVPKQLGPYRLTRLLGEGGMGIVYLAERDDLGSVAAVKILRDAWMSPARQSRFAKEQRTLAQLYHPSVARIYDAGATQDGTPWFAMEYVEGLPLTVYSNERGLPARERLQLFRSVCEAVDYAHRHAVIHRDIKPSNILVSQDGVAKLLDFGIAKQLDPDGDTAERTRTGLRLMTPAYASPEQIRGNDLGIQTDVYSLGVVLHEMLTGQPPFDAAGCSASELERMILESPVAKPSDAASGKSSLLLDASSWADIDVLCLTAMHRDPERRYRSVEALIRDLDHYLRGEPLDARPDRFSYRAGKFLRRNRASVLGAAAALTAILFMAVFFTLRLARARDAAVAQAARTERIQKFMLNLFDGGDQKVGPRGDLKVVSLLDRGLQEARSLQQEPLVQAELYRTLGGLYQKLGQFDQADSMLRSSLEQRKKILGAENPDVARGVLEMGLLRMDEAKFEQAEAMVREGLEKAKSSLPPGDPVIAEATLALGRVLDARGEYQKAIPVLEDALRLAEARGAVTKETADSLVALSSAHFYLGHHDICDTLNRRALDVHQRLNGENHPLVAEDLINLGASQFERGAYAEAEKYDRQALDIKESFYGKGHFETASTLTALGRALVFEKRFDEAAADLERALEIQEKAYGPVHPRVASALNELGNVAVARDRFEEAEARFRRVLDIYRKIYGSRHYLIGIATSNLASIYMNRKRYAVAEPLFRDALDQFEATLPPSHINTGIARIKLGRTLLRQRRYREAEEQTLSGHQIVSKQASPSVSFLTAASKDLVEIYEALHEPEKAQAFRGPSK
jgi:serine/threonine protein kinase/tetratricopeptide (TPR) repeat protein